MANRETILINMHTFKIFSLTIHAIVLLDNMALKKSFMLLDNMALKKSFNYDLTVEVAKTLSHSKYFIRNGDCVDKGVYIVSAIRLIYQKQFKNNLMAY